VKNLLCYSVIVLLFCTITLAQRNVMFLSDATFATEEMVSMGLSIKSTDDIRGFQFNIEYDTSHVLFDTLVASDIINQFTLLANESAKGTVKIMALSFSGEKIEKGVKKLLFIKFNIRDEANFTHTKINISEPVLSDVNGSSIVPQVFPGYIVSNEQSYLTASRVQPSWYFNLVNVIDYAALQFTFNYDTNIVTVDSVKSANRTTNLNFKYNQPTKGEINIVINSFDNTLLQKGSGYIAQLHYAAIDSTQIKDVFSFSEAFGVDASGVVSQIITLDSYHINTPPVISEIADVSGHEDTDGKAVLLSASDIDGDALTYSAFSDTSGLTVTISKDTLRLKPVADYFGMSKLTAVVSDGILKDSTTFSFTVLNVQDAPYPFDWVSTASDSINISQSNLSDKYDLKWNTSKEVDGEVVDYLIYAQVGQTQVEMIHDTTDTSYAITYQEILENVFEPFPMLPRVIVKFSIEATDGIDTVKVTGDDRVVFVNRYEYLSTESEGIPTEFALHENYPNPFNPTTTLRFDLPELSDLTLTIYNMLGQRVRTFNMQGKAAGYHTITWDATNDFGEQVGAGVYLYQLQAIDFVKTRKMVLLK